MDVKNLVLHQNLKKKFCNHIFNLLISLLSLPLITNFLLPIYLQFCPINKLCNLIPTFLLINKLIIHPLLMTTIPLSLLLIGILKNKSILSPHIFKILSILISLFKITTIFFIVVLLNLLMMNLQRTLQTNLLLYN